MICFSSDAKNDRLVEWNANKAVHVKLGEHVKLEVHVHKSVHEL